jgi:hypothetical protein
MATGTESGEGTGDNTEPHPITAPFDWGLGSASSPVPAVPTVAPVPPVTMSPVPDSPAPAAVPDAPAPATVPDAPTELIAAGTRPEPYFTSDSDDDLDPQSPIESPIDSLFGETEFKDYEDEPLVGPIPARLNPFASVTPEASAAPVTGPNDTPPAARPPRAPLSKNQKLLFWVAGGVIALLVLAVLFVIGTKIPVAPTPVAATTKSTPKVSPSPTPTLATTGPAAAGPHLWSDLRGGECLDPYTNPFELRYTVVDCAAPHPAQMVFRGTFPGQATVAYPGLEALQSQINLLCSAPGVIDLATAGAYSDIQFQASYAATAEEWTKGQHDYFCFVNRSGGEPLTGSVAGTPAK